MATIFLTTPTQVAEHSENGKIYLNISMRLTEKGETIFEVKTSTLAADNVPAICITEVEKIAAFSGRNVDVKKKCEEAEKQIRTELEEAGFTVYQGTVSDGNSQRFSVPITEVMSKEKVLKNKVKQKKEKGKKEGDAPES